MIKDCEGWTLWMGSLMVELFGLIGYWTHDRKYCWLIAGSSLLESILMILKDSLATGWRRDGLICVVDWKTKQTNVDIELCYRLTEGWYRCFALNTKGEKLIFDND